ncbi:hypothetical protein SmJEL517_g04920 [Synchytrium microbalum]|uniref:UBZ4-type domain-containing protein n=1 Tax=Synchytrium microbalum TaxID=1806994 RepID=A0A507BS03_9FUNG|nr:uncharacterized protein SmJEL517_g04920 [Synchytrium microbalum]TPX31877.1 hypothetical protein SmJEL517_g04920 [Synchytrium microbalum]
MKIKLVSFEDVPYEKKLGRDIIVDGFKYRNPGFTYFLSHYHADHYQGITGKTWDVGVIYCGPITASLLINVMQVPAQYVKALEPDIPHPLPNDQGTVTLMDANHCPGANVMLFELKDGRNYLHVGDFRYDSTLPYRSPGWKRVSAVQIDELFLDTTYCRPKHTFPKQDVVVSEIGRLVSEYVKADAQTNDKTLFVIATYTIGKEKVLHEIAKTLKCKVFVTKEKLDILKLLDLEYIDIFTLDPRSSQVNIVSWNQIGEMAPGGWRFLPNWDYCQQYYDWHNSLHPDSPYTRLIGLVPTGWTWELSKTLSPSSLYTRSYKEPFTIHQIPYSEHSSFEELRDCVKYVRPARVVPTVLGSKAATIEGYFKDLVDTKRAKQKGFQSLFGSSSSVIRSSSPVIATNVEDDADDEPTVLEVEEETPITSIAVIPTQQNQAENAVSCPCCNKVVPEKDINAHLDSCLNNKLDTIEPSSSAPKVIDKRKHAEPIDNQSATKRKKTNVPKGQTTLSSFFSSPPKSQK